MKEYFLKLYQYNAWANARVLGSLTQQKVLDDKILLLMSHVLSAQFLWFHRIKHLPPPPYKLWEQYSLDKLVQMGEEVGRLWLMFIDESESFNHELSYRNFKGESYVNNVEHIMIHLVNHCTYHRGQVALLMREKGFEPINTDYITYDRATTGQLKA